MAWTAAAWRPIRKGAPWPNDIQRIADRLAPAMRRRFLAAISGIQDAASLEALTNAVRARDVGQIEQILRVPSAARDFQESAAIVLSAFQQAGYLTMTQLGDAIGESIAFNLTNPLSVAWAQQASAGLIAGLQEATRGTIRSLIAEGLQQGVTAAETARLLRASIGLTDNQAIAVINYRYDLIDAGRTVDDIARLTARYARQLINYRANTIAITETQTSVQQGQRQAWQQAADQGYLRRDQTRRVWVIDPGACPICEAMDGQTVGFDEPFLSDGETFDMPPRHPRCQCVVNLEFV
ncbi:MAG: phage head morphogenesis protein [Acidobacteria bacterium]|nr:phage head morphogenesis protein [Acidobacteriota bacterium]